MLNIIIKTGIIYAVIIFSMRVMGKRIAGQLQPYELVISLMIAEVASAPIDSSDTPLLNGLIPAFTLLLLYTLISYLSLKSRKLRILFCGRPSVLIRNGKLEASEFEKLSYSLSDLMEQLRSAGYSDISQICYAILETNGELSVIPYPSEDTPSAKELGLKIDDDSIELPVILDGDSVEFGLNELGFTDDSLGNWLKNKKFPERHDIFYLSISKSGDYFCQTKNGKMIKKQI